MLPFTTKKKDLVAYLFGYVVVFVLGLLCVPFFAEASVQTVGSESGISAPGANFNGASTVYSGVFFTAGYSEELLSVRVYIKKVGSPTPDAQLLIQTGDSSAPSGTTILTSSTIAPADISSSCAEETFTFSTGSLTASTDYWLIYTPDDTNQLSDSNYYDMCGGGAVYTVSRYYNGLAGTWHTGTDWPAFAELTTGTREEEPDPIPTNLASTSATTTLSSIGNSVLFGEAIIMTLLWLIAIGLVFNSISNKKQWQRS